ncbi:uncharacterized protein PHACADRAFT_264864 [Phanerochaete carnosa HHB-10118-sp]|uniref:Uncharacterized protein n=1 Tax=Phanerochaete carnosa (strain HHB-10118-sp) TaxID=650164 RepID=K5VGA4_PHACS|nr:uncharacterized protein PHACADRAFT_264864 [Phanerochaete carnosa HHB-10118-sp]EKM50248.1 hypothetical protein PHACADRAFT_264864 [Phanerochaete carnosa HHB-10118-sp]
MKSKQGRKSARVYDAYSGAVFFVTSATPELAGATATAGRQLSLPAQTPALSLLLASI